MAELLHSRQASGLVRAFRISDVFIFNTLGFAVGLVVSLTPSFLALQQPQADVQATLTIGFVACIFNGLLYADIAGIMPRSGGDYVFISRVLSPAVGFCANWGLTWSQLFGIGAYAAWSVTTALAPGLVILGIVNGSQSLQRTGRALADSPTSVALIALVILSCCLVLSLRGLITLRRFLLVGFVVAMVGTLVTVIRMFAISPDQAKDALDQVLRQTDGSSLRTVLDKFGGVTHVAIESTNWKSAFLALPIGYWAYLGFTYSAYLGGEVSQPRRAQFIGIVGALVFGFIAYFVILGRYYDLFGREAIAAFAYSERHAPELLPVGSTFLIAVGAIAGRGVGGWIAVLSFFLWYFLLLVVMTQVCVRNIFAWAVDGIIPEGFRQVSTSRAVPRNAIVAVVLLGSMFATSVAFGLINFVNYVALFATCYLITGLAATVLPRRRPDLLIGRGPNTVTGFKKGRLLFLGLTNVVIFSLILLASLYSTDFSGVPATIWPSLFLLMVYVGGYGVFLISSRRTPTLDRELRVSLPAD
jgi:amino acid transporter